MNRLPTRNGQTALYIILLAAILVAMTGLKKCDRGMILSPLDPGNSGADTLDIGVVYGPLSYYMYADTLGGLNYDLLRRLGNDTGRKLKLWPVANVSEALNRLEKGNFDMLASLPLDNDLRSRFPVTNSVFLDRLVLVQREDGDGNVKVRSALDLGNDTVYIQKGSSAAGRMRNLSEETGTEIPVSEKSGLSEEYLCMKVASGEFPLAVVNEKTAMAMKEKYPALSYDNPVSFTQFQVWVVNPADTVLAVCVSRWLDSISETPFRSDLFERYLGIKNDKTESK